MDTVTYPDHGVESFLSAHFVNARLPIKQHADLARDYVATWTPNIVILDEEGRVHYRIEGYLPPEDFLAHVSLGLGKYRLNQQDYRGAEERFSEVARRHADTAIGAQATYWLAVARYKASGDPNELRPTWERLAAQYPESEWTRRARIPGMS